MGTAGTNPVTFCYAPHPLRLTFNSVLRTPKVPSLWAPAASDFAAFYCAEYSLERQPCGAWGKELYAKVGQRKCSC